MTDEEKEVKKRLKEKLTEKLDEYDFVVGVISCVKEKEDREQVIEFMDMYPDATPGEIDLFTVFLIEHKERGVLPDGYVNGEQVFKWRY